MQPSANWGTDYARLWGFNKRAGVSTITDPDFTDYPAFHFNELQGDAYGQPGNAYMHTWWTKNDIFPLNQPITDWSCAYTGVNSTELSHTNIGVFDSTDFTSPKYKTDNTDIQQIAFITGTRYNVNINDHGARPRWAGVPQFPVAPYSNNLYVYSPNAAGKEPNPSTFDLSQTNFNGYATTIRSFGIKSWFLEIRVSTVFIGGESDSPLPNPSYTLKEYLAITQTIRDVNPISRAYARCYGRNSTAGTYGYQAEDLWQLYPVLSAPFSGNGVNNIYCYFNLLCSLITNTNNVELPLFGIPVDRSTFYNRIYTTPQSGFLDFFYGYDHISGVTDITTDNCVFYMLPTEENIEYLRRCCAGYGLFFCDDHIADDDTNLAGGSAELTRWTNSSMMLGTIEEDGYTRGNYTRGADNANARQFNWTDSTDSTYNPDVPPVPTHNEYSHATVFNTIGDLATLTKRYVLSDSDIQLLGTELFKVTDDIFTQYSSMLDYIPKINSAFLTNNPLDCIVSLQKYPIEIPKAATPENIRLGSNQTNAIGYKFDAPCLTFLFGGKKIFPRFGNSFLDYNPFTRFEIYVPFCGTVELNPADILNRVLNVELIVDMSTGTCTGYIESDDLVIETVNGNVAIDIPVSGIDAATVNANLNNAAVNARTAFNNKRANSGLMSVSNNVGIMDVLQPWKWGGKATSMVAGSLNSGYAAQKANYDLMHTQAPIHVIGSVSPVGAWAIDLNCRLLVYYPTGSIFDLDGDGLPVFNNKLAQFGALQGFATAETGNLNQYKGLTIAVEPRYTNMRTNSTTNSRALSADELDLITAALSEGIINNIS